ncbi:AMP-binding protein [Rhodococcus sp. X156]|uniref:class I adenylate-forming enzyme family protein n=1 Tax=Rhodococcus sp. X156 TaxID=2499145 RepID=UPI000FDBE7A0|nr:AMP-binding protein [Rhodococcus sp. X156]
MSPEGRPTLTSPLLPVATTLPELCRRRAVTHGTRLAVRDTDRSRTYAALAERAGQVATALAARGVRAGDAVVVCGRSSVSWVEVALGVVFAGAVLVPVGHAASSRERRLVLDRVAPRLVLSEQRDWEPDVEVHTLAGLQGAADGCAVAEPVAVSPEAVAVVLPTSGTTGTPKHVPMTHGQLVRCYTDMAAAVGVTATDVLLGAVPLAHSFGFNGVLLLALVQGAAVRLVSPHDRGHLAEILQREGISVVLGPPTIFHDLATAGADLTGVTRLAITGGADVSVDRMQALCTSLGITTLVSGYGLTEACGSVAVATVGVAEEGAAAGLTPLPGVEVAVVDDAGRPVHGADGRVLVRGYNVMSGYLHDAAETALVLRPQGWLDTGDVGRLDSEGRLHVVSRAKDTVVVSGFNIYPREVEQVLLEHDGVADVAVLGVPDERQGEKLVACVVPRAGWRLDPAELTSHCRDRLTPYKVPRTLLEYDLLPTTATGKRSRVALRESVLARAHGRVSSRPSG